MFKTILLRLYTLYKREKGAFVQKIAKQCKAFEFYSCALDRLKIALSLCNNIFNDFLQPDASK